MWFKKDTNTSPGIETRPLSLARVRSLFDAQGWTYEFNEADQILTSGFAFTPVQILSNDSDLTVITMARSEKVTAAHLPEVLDWIESAHENHPFPTITAAVDEDTNQLTAITTFTIPGAMEYSDTQLLEWVNLGIDAMQVAFTSFFETFDPAPLDGARAEGEADQG